MILCLSLLSPSLMRMAELCGGSCIFTLHCYHFHPRLTHIHTYSTGEVTKTTTSVNNDSSLLGLSYQLASVDVSGRVVVWVVAEVTHPDPHGSETDFGEEGQRGGAEGRDR